MINKLKVRKTISILIKAELIKANQAYPELFQSRHEAYALLKEEIEEAQTEFESISDSINNYWYMCKNDKSIESKKALDLLTNLEFSAINAIMELIQVAAMIEKSKYYEKNKKIKRIDLNE